MRGINGKLVRSRKRGVSRGYLELGRLRNNEDFDSVRWFL